MKQKKIYLIAGIGIIVIVFFIYLNYKSTPLEEFCKPDSNYKNIHNFSDEYFLALSISHKISDSIQMNQMIAEKTIKEILENPTGDCDEMSLILEKCYELYGFQNIVRRIAIFNITNDPTGHHSFILLKINDKNYIFDPTLSQAKQLFLNEGAYIFNFWDVYYESSIEKYRE